MAWTTLPTYTDGQVLTAAHMLAIRDNINETGAAKVTAAGEVLVSTGANTLAARGLESGRVTGGSQLTSSSSFGDLITTGPVCTVSTGTEVLVLMTAFIANDTANQGGYMGYAVSGATTVAAATERSLRIMSPTATQRSRMTAAAWQTSLNVGTNVFTAKYRVVNTGTADFDERELTVLPLA